MPSDIATVSIRLKAEAKTTSDALNQVNILVQEAVKLFKQENIAAEDYSTSNLGFTPVYDYIDQTQVLRGQ